LIALTPERSSWIRSLSLLQPLLLHHAAAEEAHREQHQRIKTHRHHGEQRIDAEHRRQGEGVGQGGVGEAEHGESE